MSTLIAKNVQIGADTTATNNFTIYQPATPNGTLLIGNGNTGITSSLVALTSAGNLGLGVTPSAWSSQARAIQLGIYSGFYQNASGIASMSFNSFQNTSNIDTYRVSANPATKYEMGGNHAWYVAPSGTAGNAITFTQAMTLDSSGNLGLGVTPSAWDSVFKAIDTSTTASIFSAATNNNFGMNVYYNSGYKYKTTGNNAAYLRITSGGAYEWYNAPSGTAGNAISFTQAMTLDASGNLLVGKTASAATSVGFQVGQLGEVYTTKSTSTNADATYYLYSTGAGAYRFYVGLGGTISATSTTITGISDQRLKENIRDLDDGLDIVMALKPRKFDWKAGKGQDIKNARGFIAQEFEQVLPDMIEEWKDPAPEGEEPYKAVNANLIPTLVKAIQEQQALIQSLQADVAALKAAA